ncbi:MAG: hypothetical protein ISR58_02095 [Anaerolineales bacterium]|nr:hypothetical protein [Chloroflexota bacterium]MBL6979958.1 hypothetical protein [Anaerolineales bacterium]
MQKRTMIMLGLVLALTVLLVGATSVFAQSGDCTDCHNDTTVITGKKTATDESMHGMGESYVRGTRNSCVGCHSGGGFSDMVAAGLAPNELETGDPDPTRQDCRACHQVHVTYTAADWALETTDPVAFYAFEGVTYDGGKGNLCASCHQPRRGIAEVDADGNIEVTSTHWGPHHGGQGAMLLGIAGAGDVEGAPGAHATMVADTCVTCHLGEGADHTFEPAMASCTGCHADAESFDINGVQTEVQAMLDELGEKLIAAGLLDEEGHPAVMVMPADQANALWNWIFIAHEDGSLGVHNPAYTKALLEASLAVFP